MDVAPFFVTLALLIPAELPDKTFVATLVLSTRFPPLWVWLGVSAAFAVQTTIAVVAGQLLTLLPHTPVQLVTADAKVLTASASENPDLFWAVRGGGGNFGVAVSFEYRLHPVGPTVTAGVIAHPFAAARDLLRFFRELTSTIPDEMTAYFGVIHAPDGSGAKLAAIVVCHAGSLEAGEAAVRPV